MDIDCSRLDKLELRDGDSPQSPIIGTFCGTYNDAFPTIQTTQPFLWLKFTSNYLGTGKGFYISYESVNETKWTFNSGSCGGHFNTANGIITSPSFPNSYSAAKDCVYVISVLSGHFIDFAFSTMDINCHASGNETDKIEIRDSKLEESPLSFGIPQCGNVSTFPAFKQTTQNYLWVR